MCNAGGALSLLLAILIVFGHDTHADQLLRLVDAGCSCMPLTCYCYNCRIFISGMSLLLSYMNWRGLTVVGHSLLASGVIIIVECWVAAALFDVLLCVPHACCADVLLPGVVLLTNHLHVVPVIGALLPDGHAGFAQNQARKRERPCWLVVGRRLHPADGDGMGHLLARIADTAQVSWPCVGLLRMCRVLTAHVGPKCNLVPCSGWLSTGRPLTGAFELLRSLSLCLPQLNQLLSLPSPVEPVAFSAS